MRINKESINGPEFFNETQRFRVKWLWIILIGIVLFSFVLTLMGPWANPADKKVSFIALALMAPVELSMLYLFYVIKLETVVSKEGLYYRWLPFFQKYSFIARKDIETAMADDGPAFSYGFHFMPGYGWTHNTGPGKGMRITLIGGKRIFIGTADIASFHSAVDKMIKANN